MATDTVGAWVARAPKRPPLKQRSGYEVRWHGLTLKAISSTVVIVANRSGFFKVDPGGLSGWSASPGQITGIYEDNDPSKRLLVVCDCWTTLGQYRRYVGNDAGSGLEQGGPAYHLGMNYCIYGLSH